MLILSEKRGWSLTDYHDMTESDLHDWLHDLNDLNEERQAAMDA